MTYYDYDGHPLSLYEWVWLMDSKDCHHIAMDIVKAADETPLKVSTIWLGIDYGFGEGPPLIFETMIFAEDMGALDYQVRTPTKHAALAEHDQAMAWAQQWSRKVRKHV